MPIVFADTLPEGCPPEGASLIASDLDVFRLVEANPPSETDFISYWHLYPRKRESYIRKPGECVSRALSVYDTFENCQNIQRLPTMKDKVICKVTVNNEAGVIMEKGQNGHICWWLAQDFDPIENSEVVE